MSWKRPTAQTYEISKQVHLVLADICHRIMYRVWQWQLVENFSCFLLLQNPSTCHNEKNEKYCQASRFVRKKNGNNNFAQNAGGRFYSPRAEQAEKLLKWFTALQAIKLSYMPQITRQVTYLCDGSNLPKTNKTFSTKEIHAVSFVWNFMFFRCNAWIKLK